MKYEISGVIAQNVTVELEPKEFCWSIPGGLISYEGDINWTVKIPGGFEGAVKRMMSGESLKLTYIEAKAASGKVTFNSGMPGKIFAWDLKDGDIITTRGSFIGAVGDIDISVSIAKKAGAALFGGAGLILQTISGTGTVFVHGMGDFIVKELAKNEELTVSTGNLAAFSRSAEYDIKGVGGIYKTIMGGEGFFMTRLTGPGKVLLQSMKRGSSGSVMAAAAYS